jgi:hypothetical protein
MRRLYSLRVWATKPRPFHSVGIEPIWQVVRKGKKLLYGFYPYHYHDAAEAQVHRAGLLKLGFTKVELVEKGTGENG